MALLRLPRAIAIFYILRPCTHFTKSCTKPVKLNVAIISSIYDFWYRIHVIVGNLEPLYENRLSIPLFNQRNGLITTFIKVVSNYPYMSWFQRWFSYISARSTKPPLKSWHVWEIRCQNLALLDPGFGKSHQLELSCDCPMSMKWPWKTWLTLYVLNFSEGTKTYIYISCHSSTFTWHRWLKSLPK